MTSRPLNIMWFRHDLRLSDNPALVAAAEGDILPLYILDDTDRPMGGAAKWWLHHSLAALRASLGRLIVLQGNPLEILPRIAKAAGAAGVYWNRLYEPHAVNRDTRLKSELSAAGYLVESFKAGVLFEPWEVKGLSGEPYKVFTPFWRACQKLVVDQPLRRPALALAEVPGITSVGLDLLPHRPWAAGFSDVWTPGESGAQSRLLRFLESGLNGYASLRDRPDLPHVSRLSPHLHFGEITPRQIWTAIHAREPSRDGEKFLSEIGWREFAMQLLYHHPGFATTNWKREFDAYAWADNQAALRAWQMGKTGYPFVDAGMRELWATGFMHNRVRMVAASFLIKHLRIHWRKGESWFWDTLLDADAANNAAGWQWVAGSGADAAPYFRIFNPVEQGRKFDPDGAYVRKWCPELAQLPNEHIHAPFAAPEALLRSAAVRLGTNYPLPIVDHATARASALAAYAAMKGQDAN